MRIFEIANAEEQLGLLRVIIDNTWTAIAQQAERQRQEQLKQQSKPKFLPKKAAKSSPFKRTVKPPEPKNISLNHTQNPSSANQQQQQIVPSPEQNNNVYRGYIQNQNDLKYPQNDLNAITSNRPK